MFGVGFFYVKFGRCTFLYRLNNRYNIKNFGNLKATKVFYLCRGCIIY